MEVSRAIDCRRAVRAYLSKPVPESAIEDILSAGAMAPSAMHREPCRYIVITNAGKIRELSGKVKEKAGAMGLAANYAERMKLEEDVIFYSAPLLILICAEPGDFIETDCALAAQNMMLRAYDLGLGSCFIGFAKMLNDDKETLRGLGMEGKPEIICPLIFGYPKEQPHAKSRDAKVLRRI